MMYVDAKKECEALANRELTAITSRQLTKKDALDFLQEEIGLGSTAHLARLK